MIRIKRAPPETDGRRELALREVEYLRSLGSNQVRYQNAYKDAAVKSLLFFESCDKCIYCESKITHVYAGDVEHIKPKARFIRERLSYTNLGLACWACNNRKGDEFSALNPIIDPYVDDPESHFIFFGGFVRQRPGSARGKYTLELLGLNDVARGLPERRERLLNELCYAIDRYFAAEEPIFKAAYKREVDEMLGRCAEFAATARAFARQAGYEPQPLE